ncbi:MAG: hypothetical protein AB7S75_15310 [Desulfococcaceae bacterium]
MNVLNKKTLREAHFINLITIIHPLEKIEGGITQSEFRGLIRLAESYIGSRKTYVWTGRELNDFELLNLDFPKDNSGKLGWCDSAFEKELIVTDSKNF